MSATNTASDVIRWALSGLSTSKAPPQGSLNQIEVLSQPSLELCQLLATLAVVTAARLRLNYSNVPLSGDSIAIAISIGSSNTPALARRLLKLIPETPQAQLDAIVRYGLIAPALPFFSEEVADEYRQISPLTEVLERPGPGREGQALTYLQQLLGAPDSRATSVQHFAEPVQDRKLRDWRQTAMSRLWRGTQNERAFVLDIYETATIYYQDKMEQQIRLARTTLRNQAACDDQQLRQAISIANWWQPLWAIAREDNDALRTRRALGYGYDKGIALFKDAQKLTGEAQSGGLR